MAGVWKHWVSNSLDDHVAEAVFAEQDERLLVDYTMVFWNENSEKLSALPAITMGNFYHPWLIRFGKPKLPKSDSDAGNLT